MSEPDSVIGGRYRLIRRIGRGGMGEVWLAQDELLDRQVAVKRLLTGSAGGASTADATTDDLDKLLREARLAARLNHPNAVSVFDVVVEAGSGRRPDVVMEYVPGDTLADKIKRRGRIPVEEVRRIGAAIADALAEAHRLGIVHRDLKPANIMVTDRGVPKLTDFGIARLDGDSTNTVTGFMLGTPAFLAPEIARGGNADAASDVWSLGITLYAALDGHSPFQTSSSDNTLAILSRLVTSTASPPRHGGELTPVIMRMIAGNPRERPLAHEAAALLRAPAAARWAGPAAGPAGSDASTLPRQWPGPPGGYPGPRTGPSGPTGPTGPTGPSGPSGPHPVPGPSGPHPLSAPSGPHAPHTPSGPRPPYAPTSAYTPPPSWSPTPQRLPVQPSGPPPQHPQHPQHPPAPPGPRPGGGSNRTRSALIGGGALVAIAAVVAIVVATTSGDDTPAAGGSSPAVTSATGPTDFASVTASSTAETSAPVTGSGAPSLGPDEAVYRGPGGIAVAAPTSWTADDSAGIAAVRDFRAPGASSTSTGSFFRIGIGNTQPADDIKKEAAGTVASIKSSGGAYTAVKILKVTYVAGYQGTTAADIEFTGTNASAVQRHVKLRIWIRDGHTLEIELNSPTTLFSLYVDDVFPRLVNSCVVS